MEKKRDHHHIWCSFYNRQREGCNMCERLYEEYPYEMGSDIFEDLMERHFPDNIIIGEGGGYDR